MLKERRSEIQKIMDNFFDLLEFEDPVSVGSKKVKEVLPNETGDLDLAYLDTAEEEKLCAKAVRVPKGFVKEGQRVEVIVRRVRQDLISQGTAWFCNAIAGWDQGQFWQIAIRPLREWGKDLHSEDVKSILRLNPILETDNTELKRFLSF